MAIRKIKGSWWIDFQIEGTRYRKRSPENTSAGAKVYETHLRQRLSKGEKVEATKLKVVPTLFEEYVKTWFATYVTVHNKPSEQSTKETILRLHLVPWFGKMSIQDIGIVHIEKFKAEKLRQGLVSKTINNHLAVLNRCLRSAEEWGVIKFVPHITLLKVAPQRFDYLTPLESHQLVQESTEPLWSNMVRLGLRTGLRRGELAGLDWSDIDLDRKVLTVRRSHLNGLYGSPKNNRIRHIPLTEDAKDMLTACKEKHGPVFHLGDHKPLDKSVMGGAIIRVAKRAGLRSIGWHTLRHTFASCLAAEGVPIPVIKELLGHSSIQMTMRYSHFAPSSFQDAVSVLEAAEKREVQKKCQPAVNRSEKIDFTSLFSPISCVQIPQ